MKPLEKITFFATRCNASIIFHLLLLKSFTKPTTTPTLAMLVNKTIFNGSHVNTGFEFLQCEAPIPSPRRGALVGLAPSNWNMKHYKLVEFLSIIRMSSHPHKCKGPLHKRKDPLLKTFCRRFCEAHSCGVTVARIQSPVYNNHY